MLLLGSKLIGAKVLSLQTGRSLGTAEHPVINPSNLKVLAYHVEGPLVDQSDANILRVNEIRELSPIGMIIDSIDDLVEEEDVVKIKDILELNFGLIGHKVVTKKGKRVGKVIDYTLDAATFEIQQLVVHRPIMNSLNNPELTIHRNKIVEIDDYKVVIDSDREDLPVSAPIASPKDDPGFVNPFRKQKLHHAKSTHQD
jgi:sporulation protein YlmC with PRC-barrel domain